MPALMGNAGTEDPTMRASLSSALNSIQELPRLRDKVLEKLESQQFELDQNDGRAGLDFQKRTIRRLNSMRKYTEDNREMELDYLIEMTGQSNALQAINLS